MNISVKKHLPRRTFLRGIGAVMGLPLLDAMAPAFAAPANSKSPSRMAFLYFPNGVQVESWWPKVDAQTSALTENLPPVLQPLAPLRGDVLLLGGLTNDGGRAHGDGPGDHGRAGAAYLTGAHPKKTFGKDIQAGLSIDQMVAQKLGGQTRYASLELGCEEGIQGGIAITAIVARTATASPGGLRLRRTHLKFDRALSSSDCSAQVMSKRTRCGAPGTRGTDGACSIPSWPMRHVCNRN